LRNALSVTPRNEKRRFNSKLLAPAHRRRNRYRPGEQHFLIPIEDDDHIKREPSNDRKGRGDPTCS
jgi:hypothetical protein